MIVHRLYLTNQGQPAYSADYMLPDCGRNIWADVEQQSIAADRGDASVQIVSIFAPT